MPFASMPKSSCYQGASSSNLPDPEREILDKRPYTPLLRSSPPSLELMEGDPDYSTSSDYAESFEEASNEGSEEGSARDGDHEEEPAGDNATEADVGECKEDEDGDDEVGPMADVVSEGKWKQKMATKTAK